MSALGWIILILVIAAALIALAAWFYDRATNEVALVRTGAGGRRVVIDGGLLALPFFHQISRSLLRRLPQGREISIIPSHLFLCCNRTSLRLLCYTSPALFGWWDRSTS